NDRSSQTNSEIRQNGCPDVWQDIAPQDGEKTFASGDRGLNEFSCDEIDRDSARNAYDAGQIYDRDTENDDGEVDSGGCSEHKNEDYSGKSEDQIRKGNDGEVEHSTSEANCHPERNT